MREFFSWLLLINAWGSLLGSLAYGWVLYSQSQSSLSLVVGMVVGLVSLLFWLGVKDWHTATTKAAEVDDPFVPVRHQLAALEALVKAQAAQLQTVQQGVTDLNEGLSDVLEEVINRLPESKGSKKEAPVAVLGLDLSKIPEAK